MSTTPTRVMSWSKYQTDIFDFVAQRKESLVIEAVAGAGKTSTIVEAINHVPSNQSVCFLAFNRSIADELKRRITAPNAVCMTLHAAGFAAWRRHTFPEDVQVNSKKCSKVAMDILKELGEPYRKFGSTIRLVSIAKNSAIVPTKSMIGEADDDHEMWEDLIEFYGLDPEECDIQLAREVLRRSIELSDKEVDFDDMLYMSVISNAAFEKYDVIFLDEAQDVSEIQIEMVSRMRNSNARVISCGDKNQSIYGFRGALCDSMNDIQDRFNAQALPLSISYRCPQRVVKHVQQWVPEIEWHPQAEQGLVFFNANFLISDFNLGDVILCRNSRPTVELAFRLIRSKVPAKVLGREIGSNLIKLVEKMKAADLVDLDNKLLAYREREAKRPKMDEAKLAALDDKIETIRVFMEELPPTDIPCPDCDGTGVEPQETSEYPPEPCHLCKGKKEISTTGSADVQRLVDSINALFAEAQDGSRMVTLSTIHKAKGLEWDRVFILDADKYMPSKWAKEPWQKTQEQNLQYVAATRSKRELRYILSDGLK